MPRKVYYNGELLELDGESASQLLKAFGSGESGVIQLNVKPGVRILYVAYGPGIPFIFDDNPEGR